MISVSRIFLTVVAITGIVCVICAEMSLARPPAFYGMASNLPTAELSVKMKKAISILEKEFDQVCGDTFCEGDYANLHSTHFDCVVTLPMAQIKECIWQFAGTYAYVDGYTGKVTSGGRTYICRFSPQETAEEFFDELISARGSALEHLTPKGMKTPIYDVLTDCL